MWIILNWQRGYEDEVKIVSDYGTEFAETFETKEEAESAAKLACAWSWKVVEI